MILSGSETGDTAMIFRSPFRDVELPDFSLTPFVLRHAAQLADKPALIDGPTGRLLTYGQLADDVRRAAAGLTAHGFSQGNTFAITAPNSIEYVVAFHAVTSLGGVITTINPVSTIEDLAYQLSDAGATFLLTTPELLEKTREAAMRARVRQVFVIGESTGATPYVSLLKHGDTLPPVTIDPREDIAALLYSSGTTGWPKGVMLTHANLVANIVQSSVPDPMTPDDTIIATLPFFHAGGIVFVVNRALHGGATVVILPRFELEPFLRVVQDYRVTRAIVVPPIVLALAKQPIVDHYDLSALKVIMSVAAPLSDHTARACAERVGCVVKQGYGMTETGPALHLTPDASDKLRAGTVGPCVPNTECQVVDPVTMEAMGPGELGEIWARGAQVMRGYFNRPDATADTITPEGWIRTGDIGYADEDGWFFIVDRLKELIKYKGLQVAPAELEAVLLAHPAVADAAVIPSPDEEAGEVPKAFVVLKDAATPEELLTFVAGRVAPYKKVRRVEFVEQIPKSPSGKILRRLLVERERAAMLSLV
jgi:acyl-CoA synthetase (AMP-forming)/AMP-acid ligase II